LKATPITLFFILADELQIPMFDARHGTGVQPACVNVVFGCK